MTTTKKRLDGWINLLTAAHKAAGKTWYTDAHTFAEEVSNEYGIPLPKVVGVLACLSVQNRWDVNKRDTEALCRAWSEGLDLADVTVATYQEQKDKAIAILQAKDTVDVSTMLLVPRKDGRKVARGPKTVAFYHNILNPSTDYHVTLDRWILRGLGLENHKRNRGNSYPALYREIEELFREAAIAEGLRPCELQAAVWICIQQTADAESWGGSRPTHKAPVEEEAPF